MGYLLFLILVAIVSFVAGMFVQRKHEYLKEE
jgi:hypothetical protein